MRGIGATRVYDAAADRRVAEFDHRVRRRFVELRSGAGSVVTFTVYSADVTTTINQVDAAFREVFSVP